jgi:hypothetical protein
MAGSQVVTSVTIINNIFGFLGVSLTNWDTSALSAIAAGSKVEIGGAFFTFASNETINATSWSAIASAANAYLALTPSGTAGSQIVSASWVADVPVWSESKQAWYASASSIVRVIGSVYKYTATQQETKTLYVKGRDRIFTKYFNIGPWNMDDGALETITIPVIMNRPTIINISAIIIDDSLLKRYQITHSPTTDVGGSVYVNSLTSVGLHRTAGGVFDSLFYDDATMNRGYITITYEA